MYHDLLRSKEVKCWSKPSNQGQIGQISRNIPNIHMFRLGILSRIQIQDSLRSNQVIKRSNLGQSWVIAVKLGSNRADKSKCTQYTYGSTPNFVKGRDTYRWIPLFQAVHGSLYFERSLISIFRSVLGSLYF